MTFGGLDSLFNPAKQHMEEEKLRLQSTREEIGDASGGKRIDLDSGRVRLAGSKAESDDSPGEDVTDADSTDNKVVDDEVRAGTAAKATGRAESSATRRARERRTKAAK